MNRSTSLVLGIAALSFLGGATAPGSLDVAVSGLRSQKGLLRLCMTTQKRYFPNCDKDPNALRASVPANAGEAQFLAVPSGTYALSILHDENSNAKLDTFAGIPREGVGFSRNPSFNFGPPAFTSVTFRIESGEGEQKVRIKYFL